jgi:hypothetical protein
LAIGGWQKYIANCKLRTANWQKWGISSFG